MEFLRNRRDSHALQDTKQTGKQLEPRPYVCLLKVYPVLKQVSITRALRTGERKATVRVESVASAVSSSVGHPPRLLGAIRWVDVAGHTSPHVDSSLAQAIC